MVKPSGSHIDRDFYQKIVVYQPHIECYFMITVVYFFKFQHGRRLLVRTVIYVLFSLP